MDGYSPTQSDAGTLVDAAKRSIVGGRLNQLVWPGNRRPVIESGFGSRVRDVDGRELVDYVLGSGPLVLGHAHPQVVEALTRQAAIGSTYYALSRPIIELAERIVAQVPCAEQVQFCSTGGEATFFALRLARAATGRSAVLKFEGGYHGAHDYAVMSLWPSVDTDHARAVPSSAGVPDVIADEVLVVPFNDVNAVAEAVAANAERLAAIIVEPVQRALEPLPGFLETLRSLADQHDVVLVFDEVVTGFRLAPGGAQERYGVVPDLAALGKVLGGGLPLAAVAGSREIMRVADHERRGGPDYAFISGTLNGNPLAAAAGLATLDVLAEPGAYNRLDTLGERLRAGIADACAQAGVRAHVVGPGSLLQVVVAEERPIDYRGVKAADATVMRRVSPWLHDAGVLMSPEKTYISLAHTEDEIDHLAELLFEALTSTRR